MAYAIAADGARLHFTVEGPSGSPAILFSHSIGCDSGMWAAQVKALSKVFRTVVYDTRGHGLSDATGGDYSLSTLAADMAAVLDAAGLEKATVCGLSLGGAVAQRFALDHPSRLECLILANTGSRIGSFESWTQRIAAVRDGGMASIADMAVSRFFSSDFASQHTEIVDAVRDVLVSTVVDGYAGACAALRDSDLTAELALIEAPTLVIGGRDDVSTPPSQTEALADKIAAGRHVVLDAAHLSNLERPQEFSSAIVAFMTT